MNQRPHLCLAALGFVLLLVAGAFARDFGPEERVTTGSLNYEMSRNANHSLAVGPDGIVHLVYWDGAVATQPTAPSAVWYSRCEPGRGWNPAEMVDNSLTSEGIRLGGRHPSLLLAPGGAVHVFWHDYRHCTAAQRWIDNIEIYMDSRPPGGAFSSTDVRLTTTSAPHSGDNGYAPKATFAPDGRIFLTWYDYHFDPTRGDVFLMRSNTAGHFDPGASISAHRLTNATQRPGADSYTLPDVAADLLGRAHLVWTRDNISGRSVFYARSDSVGHLTTPTVLSPTGGDFFDPPHVTAAPNGDIYATWTETGGASGRAAFVARLPHGGENFGPAMPLTTAVSEQYHPDLEADGQGLLHAVWADTREGYAQVFYGVFNPVAGALVSEQRISEGNNDAFRPCIALDQNDNAHIAWMDYRHGTPQIYYRTSVVPTRVDGTWRVYR